jgi:uncharacterized membrane protein YeaQ/YmgE (transglycosylase-associated protein family)
MVNFIVWIIVGAIIGWVASKIMGTSGQQGLLLDIVVGIVGALLAGWFLTPLFGVSTINQANFSLPALLVSLLGAVLLLAIVRVIRRAGRR